MSEAEQPIPGARYLLNGDLYEVTRIDNGFVRFRGVDLKRERTISLCDVADQLKSRTLKLYSQAPIEISNAPLLASLTDKGHAQYQRKLAYVQAAFREFGASLPRNATLNLIDQIAIKLQDPTPPCYTTLYGWAREYWRAGGNPLALIPTLKHSNTRARRLDPLVVDLIKQYLREEYLKAERPTAIAIYNMFKAQIEADNRYRDPDKQISIPSRATFYREVTKLDPYAVDLARFGKQTALKNHRYGKKIHSPIRLCERVEADSNLIDVLVVDSSGTLIGRPWLCALIDVLSRCILGWEISFTPPCAAKTLRALRHTMSDSNGRLYGGTPQELILDNGPEFQNGALQNVAKTYGIDLRYVAPRSPDQKPYIERFFGTLNTQLVHLMPGTTRSNPTDRGEYPSEARACLTLDQVQYYFGFWLDHIYHHSVHDSLGMPPAEMWRSMTDDSLPRRHNAAELDIICRSFVSRALSGGRVSFSKLEWSGPSLPNIAARLRTKGEGLKARVYYDETDLAYVWVVDPDNPALLYRADAVDPDYQNGLTLFEHRLLQDARRQNTSIFNGRSTREAQLILYKQLSADGSTKAKKRIARMSAASQLDFDIDPGDGENNHTLSTRSNDQQECAPLAVGPSNQKVENDGGYPGFLLEPPL